MDEAFEVVIAGGGPSGSSTANFLRQRGRRVLVLERERFPRFHVGESLLPFSNDLWRELGVLDHMERRYLHKPGAHFVHEASGAEFTYYFDTAIRPGPSHAFHVKRAEFDQMLLERAREVGAEVREQTTVEEVDFGADEVRVHARGPGGERYVVRAPVFVDATGRDTLMAARLGTKVHDDLISTNISLNCMFAGVPREGALAEGNVVIGLFDGGWYWMIPFADGDTSVGFVLERRYTRVNRSLPREAMYAQVLEEQPRLKRLMQGARPLLPVGSEANWSYRAEHFHGDRLLIVGDAAAFVDPLFSTGILLGLNAARAAATHVDAALRAGDCSAARFAPYEEQCRAEMDIFKTLILEFYAQNLRRLLVASSVNPTICSVIVSILAGDVSTPSMWHAAVSRAGFSQIPEDKIKVLAGEYHSSREVLRASKLGRGAGQ